MKRPRTQWAVPSELNRLLHEVGCSFSPGALPSHSRFFNLLAAEGVDQMEAKRLWNLVLLVKGFDRGYEGQSTRLSGIDFGALLDRLLDTLARARRRLGEFEPAQASEAAPRHRMLTPRELEVWRGKPVPGIH